MSVYFILCAEANLVKIGYSEAPLLRLNKMKADSPHELELLAYIDGDESREAEMHFLFSDLRRRGEWFEYVDPLKSFTSSLSNGLTVKRAPLPKLPKDQPMANAVRKVIEAAGGPIKLAREWNVTYTAINTFERQGYLPLARAKDAVQRWPEAAALRDLVRPDIRAAMDLQQGSNLLG